MAVLRVDKSEYCFFFRFIYAGGTKRDRKPPSRGWGYSYRAATTTNGSPYSVPQMTRPQEKILISLVELQSETLAIIIYLKMQGRKFKTQLEHKFKISIS
jgi:hypothetical protein